MSTPGSAYATPGLSTRCSRERSLSECGSSRCAAANACGHDSPGGAGVRVAPSPIGKGAESALRLGAALELIQTCALIHDDVMDGSSLPRVAGAPRRVRRQPRTVRYAGRPQRSRAGSGDPGRGPGPGPGG
ncbi:polyprenyl synthetase family protein [Streptomyces cyaneofuscatus]